jgi:hypothetical protein
MSRDLRTAALAAVCVFAFAPAVLAQSGGVGGLGGAFDPAAGSATTVKSSKSNTSDRMGGGGGGKGAAAAKATTVKSSKSNGSERMGGGGGGKGAGAAKKNLNTSRSN